MKMQKIVKKLDREKLWSYALRSVGQRAQTTSEIRAKLRLRALEPGDVEEALNKLKEYGMIDDRKFAETFAQGKLENHGFGKGRALRDLQQRRVAPGLAEQTVQQLYADRDESLLIEAYIRRKFRTASREHLFEDEKDMASAFRKLRLAGFSAGKVLTVLKRFAAKPELLDGIEEAED